MSYALFILGIDPLIRNINNDPTIRNIDIKTKKTNREVKCKAGAYADDVHVICRSDRGSVCRVFFICWFCYFLEMPWK